ncbi:SIR2 family protein [Ruminiclostridium papyrosolvens]|uniref:SIR2 family protein n=1 Tax=Ruminiclostridium papyrosolvens TaxID=29362 RepID=UPI001FA71CDA|nr:SIR2 family protein [Ruminiclostridium papyrosolvens]
MVKIKKLFLILGNGFSIDLISQIGIKDIDVMNLFSNGARVPWPENGEKGFLSYKYSPFLWNLGAHPNISKEESLEIIEEIVTCANATESAIFKNPSSRQDIYNRNTKPTGNVYINAYLELSHYLKYLFINYDKIMDFGSIINNSDFLKWKWLKFFAKFKSGSGEYDKIFIVTYNYDIWLERMLKYLEITFDIVKIDVNRNSSVKIIKPHGSISFYDKRIFSGDINIYNKEISGPSLNELGVRYEDLTRPTLTNSIIPPAGDSGRIYNEWSVKLRKEAVKIAKTLKDNDDVILCGVSYWHVDRSEIDELLTSFDPNVNIKLINPKPPKTLNAVLTSLFNNYQCYTDTDILGV